MDLVALARRQLADYDRGEPGRVFAEMPRPLTRDEAYQVQFEVARLREARGERVAGYKIGCISRTMQAQLGLDEPVFGHVWEGECHASGCVIGGTGHEGLAVEGELAVRLACDVPSAEWLGANPDAWGTVGVVIELHHWVFRAPEAQRAAELIANNAIHAGVVLPAEGERRWAGEWLDQAGLRVIRNGEVLGDCAGRGLEGGAMSGVVRLVRHLERYGRRLRQGHLVLTGSLLPLWRVEAGDRVEVVSEVLGQRVTMKVE